MAEPSEPTYGGPLEKYQGRMKKRRAMPEYGQMEWDGLIRTIERAGADYRR